MELNTANADLMQLQVNVENSPEVVLIGCDSLNIFGFWVVGPQHHELQDHIITIL